MAIAKYLSADTDKKKSAAKGLITKVVNEIGDGSQVWVIVREFNLDNWLFRKFIPGPLSLEGDGVFGWYSERQIQIEKLPMSTFSEGEKTYFKVNFYGFKSEAFLWKERGFEEAEELPIVRYSIPFCSAWVEFPLKKTPVFIQHGYANSSPLQWSFENELEQTNYIVKRSIIPYGFWCAWKWWEGCQWWYLLNRPELFGDSELWGSEPIQPRRWEPDNDPYAVVLGANQETYLRNHPH